MSITRRRAGAIAAALSIAAVPAVAAGPAAAKPGHHHPPSGYQNGHHGHDHGYGLPADISDASFLRKGAAANQFEIVTGQIAQQKSDSGAIKALGAMFVADHTAAQEKGAAVAAKLGIDAPPALDRKQQAQVALLQRLDGKAFDYAWLAAQIKAHVDAVQLQLRGAVNGDTQDVKELALGNLPVVTRHLSELVAIARTEADD
jgi:predicted outer membrane protein